MFVELLCNKCKDKIVAIQQEHLAARNDAHIVYCVRCYRELQNDNATLKECLQLIGSRPQSDSDKSVLISELNCHIQEMQDLLEDYFDDAGEEE
jgi:hypothetical protein